jgi:cell division protein FtsA
MASLKRNIFTLVEIGSSKIICIIFSINQKEIKILSFGISHSIGIKNGIVINMKEAINSIARTVEKAESLYGKTVEDVFILISGIDIVSEIITQEVNINGRDVIEKDLKNLTNKASESLQANNERAILHSVNNGYALDGLYVSYPVGMCANQLSVTTNFISCLRIPLININQVFAGCRLNIRDHLVGCYVESFSCLTDDDKNIGVSVINFGANSTSLITFKNGCLVSCLNINIGSSLLTFDLAHAFGISLFEAEKLKLEHGTFLSLSGENYYENIILEKSIPYLNNDENFSVSSPSGVNKLVNENHVLINKYDFLSVLLARQEEILEVLISKARNLGQIFSERKLILTGGGAKISGITELVKEFIPSRNIKLYEYVDDIKIYNEFPELDLGDSNFSSCLGALKYIYNINYKDCDFDFNLKKKYRKTHGIFSKIFDLIKV